MRFEKEDIAWATMLANSTSGIRYLRSTNFQNLINDLMDIQSLAKKRFFHVFNFSKKVKEAAKGNISDYKEAIRYYQEILDLIFDFYHKLPSMEHLPASKQQIRRNVEFFLNIWRGEVRQRLDDMFQIRAKWWLVGWLVGASSLYVSDNARIDYRKINDIVVRIHPIHKKLQVYANEMINLYKTYKEMQSKPLVRVA